MIEWFFFWVTIALAGAIAFGVACASYSEYQATHKRLRIVIRKLDDGRFNVRYCWHLWENEHTDRVDPETLPAYLSDLVLNSLKE